MIKGSGTGCVPRTVGSGSGRPKTIPYGSGSATLATRILIESTILCLQKQRRRWPSTARWRRHPSWRGRWTTRPRPPATWPRKCGKCAPSPATSATRCSHASRYCVGISRPIWRIRCPASWSQSFVKSCWECRVFESIGIYMGYPSARVQRFWIRRYLHGLPIRESAAFLNP